MRMSHPDMKRFLSFAAVFNLLLILTIFSLDVACLVFVDDPIRQFHSVFNGMLTGARLSIHPLVTADFIMFSLFMLYFPFTHMTHAYTKWFTWDKILWDDRPLVKNRHLEKKINEALHYPVSWSAPHIQGDGKKNWIDVATQDIREMMKE
jgi:hypothetical protein